MEFKELGFSYYEDKALEAIIRESLTVKEIIKKTNIPPGKVYSILKSLSIRGIISESSSRPKHFFIDNPAKLISSLIEQKQNKDEDIISKMRFLANSIPKKISEDYFFKVGTTLQDNREMQSKLFIDAKKEVLQVLNSKHKPNMNRRSKDEWESAIKDAIGRGVKFRAIYHRETSIPKSLLSMPENKFEIRKTSNEICRFDVVDGKKVMIKLVYDDPLLFGGIIMVENEKLARNLKALFEDMWKKSEK